VLVITVCSAQGGVGKTTLSATLGGIIADSGVRALLMDTDIQPTLSFYFPLEQTAEDALHRLNTASSVQADALIRRTNLPNLDIVFSDDSEGALGNWIVHPPDGRVGLRHALRKLEGEEIARIVPQDAAGPLQDVGVLAADFLLHRWEPRRRGGGACARETMPSLVRELLPHPELAPEAVTSPASNLLSEARMPDRKEASS